MIVKLLHRFRWPLAILATIAIALIFLVVGIQSGAGQQYVKNGDWYTSTDIGSKDASTMLRAVIAIRGLLASNREDSMYYTLNAVAGQPLRLNCRYRISGEDYDANWWSITAYGWDYYLIPNDEDRYSFNNESVRRDTDGSWTIWVGADREEGNWLPVGAAGATDSHQSQDYDFDLLLRLYTPGSAYLQRPESAPLPQVTEESCS